MDVFLQYMLTLSKYGLVIFSVLTIFRCLRSMLSESYDSETWAYVNYAKNIRPVTHWENIIGRGISADIRVCGPRIARVQAVLSRDDKGIWRVYDVFSRSGVWIGDKKVTETGCEVKSGDTINLAGNLLIFAEPEKEHLQIIDEKRRAAGGSVSPLITLLWLSLFQFSLIIQHLITYKEEYMQYILVSFTALVVLEWLCYLAMRLMNRTGFELETLGFYLTSLGLSVAATSTPEDLYKQVFLIIASVALFALFGWWLRNLHRTAFMRIPVAVFSGLLLILNIVAGTTLFGAKNWLSIAGFSFQPSEFVKVFYIYVGASTLQRLYTKDNLYVFVGFSAVCVLALAIMGDFGSALVFFVAFLVISFMRSGSIGTIVLSISGVIMASLFAITSKQYIADRFATWNHAWDDVNNTGYQQVRAMSAAAAGGLFGKGAGAGWLKNIVAANTDMVFGIVSEELGLLVGLCAILAVISITVFAIRATKHSRSAYYSIAACASVSILLTQLALNFFGSMDVLPFTGVTFPFISRGGSSLISCWMLLAYIKSADNRREASFAVKSAGSYEQPEQPTHIEYAEDKPTEDLTNQPIEIRVKPEIITEEKEL